MSRFLKGLAVVTTLAACGAGGLAWYEKTAGAKRAAAIDADLGRCKAEVAACDLDRKEQGKTANELAASVSASQAELTGLRAEHAEAEKRLAAFKALTEKFQKMIDSGKLTIVLLHGRMVVKLPAGVLFPSGSAELSKDGKDAIRDVATILRGVPNRQFMVAGHTDNMPIDPNAKPPSPFKNNLQLSTARAVTVAEQLIASGMNKTRLVAAGYAENEPVANNNHEAGRAENRRIEIVLMPNVTELPTAGLDGGVPDGGAKAAADGGAKPDGGQAP